VVGAAVGAAVRAWVCAILVGVVSVLMSGIVGDRFMASCATPIHKQHQQCRDCIRQWTQEAGGACVGGLVRGEGAGRR
jgi:hypothetical protein